MEKPRLIPQPKSFELADGVLDLSGLPIVLAGGDVRLSRAAEVLRREIAEICGVKATLRVGEQTPGSIYIAAGGNSPSDSYRITVDENGVCALADGARGAFCAIQTLRQLVMLCGTSIPLCSIKDEPDYADRGFYHDVTRGRVPKLETLKALVDELALCKYNSLQLYVEDAFAFAQLDGVMSADETLSAAEIIELDGYCHDRFIELVPSVSSFGHLYNLLQSENYKHLCEYENYEPTQHYWIEKMAHHTIDVGNDESIEVIKSMIDQFIPLCRSDKFNICCDETFDLCRGKNAGKDAGEEYFKFVSKIVDHVKSRGKRVMMWGDIVLNHPEHLSKLPDDVIMLNWTYEKEPKEAKIAAFDGTPFTKYVCPGTSSWNRFIEETDRSSGNITSLAIYGKRHGATGILTTNWGDYGNTCPLGAEQYGIVLAAERSWNATDTPLGEDFDRTFELIAYGEDGVGLAADVIRTVEACERSAEWAKFVPWYSANHIEGRNVPIECDEEVCRQHAAICADVAEELRVPAKTNPRINDLRLSALAVKLLNELHLYLAGFEPRRPEYIDWLTEYRAAWLLTDKPSQLDRIEAFIRAVCAL